MENKFILEFFGYAITEPDHNGYVRITGDGPAGRVHIFTPSSQVDNYIKTEFIKSIQDIGFQNGRKSIQIDIKNLLSI